MLREAPVDFLSKFPTELIQVAQQMEEAKKCLNGVLPLMITIEIGNGAIVLTMVRISNILQIIKKLSLYKTFMKLTKDT